MTQLEIPEVKEASKEKKGPFYSMPLLQFACLPASIFYCGYNTLIHKDWGYSSVVEGPA